jgi:hypothetical protein
VTSPRGQWHDLKLAVHGKDVKGYLDGKLYLEHTLPEPVSGKIGLWLKADSYVLFDDYTVVPAMRFFGAQRPPGSDFPGE